MTRLSGVIAPTLTPFETDGRIAPDLWTAHVKSLLEQGAHYVSPFGTTGEALSVPLAERMRAMEMLVEAGIPASRLMPGAGFTSLGDTAAFSSFCVQLGTAAVMILPSFFFKDAGEDGHVRYFSEVVEAVASDALSVILYNIPQNTGVPVTPGLARRLAASFPDTIVAYKDSSGDWDNTLAVRAAAPSLSVFPGSESYLEAGLQAGCAGCISATVNVNCRQIRTFYDALQAGTDTAGLSAEVVARRKAVQAAGLIPAMKAMLAVQRGAPRWLNTRAPLLNADPEIGARLLAEGFEMADDMRS